MNASQEITNALLAAHEDIIEMGETAATLRSRVTGSGNVWRIETRTSRNPNLSNNGGDYFFYTVFEATPDKVLVYEDWSAEFDPRQWLGDVREYPVSDFVLETNILDGVMRVAGEYHPLV